MPKDPVLCRAAMPSGAICSQPWLCAWEAGGCRGAVGMPPSSCPIPTGPAALGAWLTAGLVEMQNKSINW